MFWKVLYLGLTWYNSRILFSVQITFSDLKKTDVKDFLRVVPPVPTHKFNLFKLMSKEKIKSYTEIP